MPQHGSSSLHLQYKCVPKTIWWPCLGRNINYNLDKAPFPVTVSQVQPRVSERSDEVEASPFVFTTAGFYVNLARIGAVFTPRLQIVGVNGFDSEIGDDKNGLFPDQTKIRARKHAFEWFTITFDRTRAKNCSKSTHFDESQLLNPGHHSPLEFVSFRNQGWHSPLRLIV